MAPLIYLGELGLLARSVMQFVLRRKFNTQLVVEQMTTVGFASLPIVLITVGCAGMVFSLYTSQGLVTHGAGEFAGYLVAFTVVRELGPIVTAVATAAAAGSAFAAQLGTMRVTEQVDALRTMAISPVAYLVVPRVLACLVILPTLCVLGAFAGIVGGYTVASYAGVPTTQYLESIRQYMHFGDILAGLTKTFFFGPLIALVSCHQGLVMQGGAAGVGRATTRAVILSLIGIYITNFALSYLLPYDVT